MGYLRYSMPPSVVGATGSFQLGIPSPGEGVLINSMKNYASQNFHTATPLNLDSDGYPTGLLPDNVGGAITIPQVFAADSVVWLLKWPATRTMQIVIGANVVVGTGANGMPVPSGATVTGGTNSSMTVTSTGAAGRVVFQFRSFPAAPNNICGMYFPSGFTYSGSGEIALVRLNDEAAYDTGHYFTPEFLANVLELNPRIQRAMGWNIRFGQGSNLSRWKYRSKLTTLSWGVGAFPPAIWGGTATGTDTYIAGLATDSSISPNSAGSWTDGEMYQCLFTNANTSTTPTLKVGSRAAKTLILESSFALFANSIPAGSMGTVVYDGVLDRLIYTNGGIDVNLPLEVHAALSNEVNADCWYVFPPWADNNFITSATTVIRDNLGANLKAFFEYGNECWNPGFAMMHWAYARGVAFNFPTSDNRPHNGWYGLRTREIMASVTTTWTATRSASSLKRVLATWVAAAFIYAEKLYKMEGADLASVANSGQGNAAFVAYTGGGSGANYRTVGNRPIDYCDVVSFAPYTQGAYYAHLDSDYTGSPACATDLQTAARNFALGGASATTALNWLHNDIYHGVLSGVVDNSTLDGFNRTGGAYEQYEAALASYDGIRSPPIEAHCYEGALQCMAPSAAACSTLGITADYLGSGLTAAGCSNALAALLLAYKNSASYGYNMALDHFNQFRNPAKYPHFKVPSWLQLTGPNEWSLLPGAPGSTPYQTYYGVKAFH